MPHLPPAHHETSKCDSPNETKVKEKQKKTIPYLNSNLVKSMTHHNQTKELTTWFLRFPVRGVTPTGRSGFHALAGPLREVRWPTKFKADHIDQYDGSSNPKEFIQVYQTIIEAVGGDDQVKANFLHTTLSGAARS
jgi:hypothetical protein